MSNSGFKGFKPEQKWQPKILAQEAHRAANNFAQGGGQATQASLPPLASGLPSPGTLQATMTAMFPLPLTPEDIPNPNERNAFYFEPKSHCDGAPLVRRSSRPIGLKSKKSGISSTATKAAKATAGGGPANSNLDTRSFSVTATDASTPGLTPAASAVASDYDFTFPDLWMPAMDYSGISFGHGLKSTKTSKPTPPAIPAGLRDLDDHDDILSTLNFNQSLVTSCHSNYYDQPLPENSGVRGIRQDITKRSGSRKKLSARSKRGVGSSTPGQAGTLSWATNEPSVFEQVVSPLELPYSQYAFQPSWRPNWGQLLGAPTPEAELLPTPSTSTAHFENQVPFNPFETFDSPDFDWSNGEAVSNYSSQEFEPFIPPMLSQAPLLADSSTPQVEPGHSESYAHQTYDAMSATEVSTQPSVDLLNMSPEEFAAYFNNERFSMDSSQLDHVLLSNEPNEFIERPQHNGHNDGDFDLGENYHVKSWPNEENVQPQPSMTSPKNLPTPAHLGLHAPTSPHTQQPSSAGISPPSPTHATAIDPLTFPSPFDSASSHRMAEETADWSLETARWMKSYEIAQLEIQWAPAPLEPFYLPSNTQ